MIYGIQIDVDCSKAKYTGILAKILSGIDVEKYVWRSFLTQCEVMSKTEEYFTREIYPGKAFLQEIKGAYYILFLKLQAHIENEDMEEIVTYEDFIKSDCQLMVLVCDCYEFEFFSKQRTIIDSICNTACSNGYHNYRFISDAELKSRIFRVINN